MRISARALALTLGVLWGGAMLIIGVVHAFTPSYGAGFFAVMGSIYPGIEGTGTAGDVILGMVYGLVDGALRGQAHSRLGKLLPRAARLVFIVS